MANRPITRELAAYATHSSFSALPDNVRAEGARAFLNWIGCTLGGCRDPAVEIVAATVAEAGGNPQSTIIGRGGRTDITSAAFLNCLSSTVLSFDDTHLATVTHPSGPVAAASFALSETRTVSGEDFVTAIALGIEIECRMSNVLLLPPARAQVGWFVTGITGPIGAAVAMGRLLELDEKKMAAAIGLASAQASGFRGTHGEMSAFMVPAHAARTGVSGTLLAAKGFRCMDNILEAPKGFVDVFGTGGDLNRAVDGLGRHFEIFANAYKPYPSGIVVQAAIDACLEIAEQLPSGTAIASVALEVHPLALELCGRRDPKDPIEGQISLFHWAAATLLQRAAGLAQLRQECLDDGEIAALRARVVAKPDAALGRDEAIAEVRLTDGTSLRSHIRHARGSAARPMTDDELDTKFRAQASEILVSDAVDALLRRCRTVAECKDVGKEVAALLDDQ